MVSASCYISGFDSANGVKYRSLPTLLDEYSPKLNLPLLPVVAGRRTRRKRANTTRPVVYDPNDPNGAAVVSPTVATDMSLAQWWRIAFQSNPCFLWVFRLLRSLLSPSSKRAPAPVAIVY